MDLSTVIHSYGLEDKERQIRSIYDMYQHEKCFSDDCFMKGLMKAVNTREEFDFFEVLIVETTNELHKKQYQYYFTSEKIR